MSAGYNIIQFFILNKKIIKVPKYKNLYEDTFDSWFLAIFQPFESSCLQYECFKIKKIFDST